MSIRQPDIRQPDIRQPDNALMCYNNYCSGIYMEHEEFKGRVVWGYDSVSDPSPRNDGNGHGTHITGNEVYVYSLAIVIIIN